MKKFLTIALTVLALAVSASAQSYYDQNTGQWWYWYNNQWWRVQAPNNQGNTAQPPPIAGNHGYYWHPGHYGPTGVWYPGLWLAY